MAAALDWIWTNRAWTLSGVAVAVPIGILTLILTRRGAAPAMKRIKQTIRARSDSVQVADVVDSTMSVGQTGGITAGTVNLVQNQQRNLAVREVLTRRPTSNEFHTQLELTVEASHPAANLVVQVEAPSLLRVDLTPSPRGIVSMSKGGELGRAWVSLERPYGVLRLDVYTAVSEPFALRWEFQ